MYMVSQGMEEMKFGTFFKIFDMHRTINWGEVREGCFISSRASSCPQQTLEQLVLSSLFSTKDSGIKPAAIELRLWVQRSRLGFSVWRIKAWNC